MVDGNAPELGNLWITAGMVIGGVLAGFAARAGWKNSAAPEEKEFAFSGQAAITDMGPVRELAKQAETLGPKLAAAVTAVEAGVQQQARTSAAVERLAGIVEGYIENQKTERENEEEIERRVAEQLAKQRRAGARSRPRRATAPKG